MPWTTEQKIFIVEAYFRQKSIRAAVPDFLDNVWLTEKAHFLFSGHLNSENNIFWGSKPREHCQQMPLHSVKCTAWVVISNHGIIRPFWFEDDNEQSVTINTERYVQVHSYQKHSYQRCNLYKLSHRNGESRTNEQSHSRHRH